jgi:hypothetical protein
MPHYFNNPLNSLKKDAHSPSSASVVYQLINPLNCPLETPEKTVFVLSEGAGPCSTEGVVPDLPQKTWVAGVQKVD